MEKKDYEASKSPYPLRMKPETRKAAKEQAKRIDRSMHWVLNDVLERGLGVKDAA